MRDKKLYSQILGIETPWFVSDVKLSLQAQQVKVFIEHTGQKGCQCRVCAKPCPGYDHIIQKWRHLDTCQFQTIGHGDDPAVGASNVKRMIMILHSLPPARQAMAAPRPLAQGVG